MNNRSRDIHRTSKEFFENKYLQNADPWKFASNPYELGRYDCMFNLLKRGRYKRAFEPGCSIGVFTAQLASLCDRVEAMDISPTAVEEARIRCEKLPNVAITCGALPASLPEGMFDLIVLSEIGYYFEEHQLAALADRLVEKLPVGGTLLAAHWLGTSEDHVLAGDHVHDILAARRGVALGHSERYASFRLDCWTRQ
jgi:protein-L-isoaspartate O-methyltransferase